jgi:hypothetical protein
VDIVRSVDIAAWADGQGITLDHRGGKGDIGGDNKILGRDMLGDVAIHFVRLFGHPYERYQG